MHNSIRHHEMYQGLWRILPVAILVCFFSISINAQESNEPRRFYVGASLLAGNASAKDSYFSSIPFSGAAYGGIARMGLIQRRSTHEISFQFNSSHTTAETVEGQTMDQVYFKGSYTFLYRITDPDHSFYFSVGGGADFQDATRTYNQFVNNYQSYEFIGSANLSALAGCVVRRGPKQLMIKYQFHLPLISVLKQPELGGTAGKWESGSWNLVQSVSNLLELKKNLNGNHQFGIGYQLNYYSIKSDRAVKQVQQFFELKYTYFF